MRGQVATEYLTFIGILLLLLVIVMAVVSAQERSSIREGIINDARRVAMFINNEVNIAVNVGDGYSHNFSIPYNLYKGVYYDVYTMYQRIYINWTETGEKRDVSIPMITDNIQGNFSKGENKIKNVNGLIKIE